MNRKEKNRLIYHCVKEGITEPKEIRKRSEGWGHWDERQIAKQLSRIEQRPSIPWQIKEREATVSSTSAVTRFRRLKDPKFKDYVALKVGGHDQYSRKRLVELESLVNDDAKMLFSDLALEDQAKGYRWILRGLSPQQARQKIEVDLEVSENAIESNRRKRYDDDEWWDDD